MQFGTSEATGVTWSGEMRSPELERSFLLARRWTDDVILRIAFAASVLAHLAFARVDLELHRDGAALAWLLGFRAVVVTLQTIAVATLARLSVPTRDRLLTGFFFVGIVFQGVVASTRPASLAGPLVTAVMTLVFILVLAPFATRARASLGLGTCACFLLGRVNAPGSTSMLVASASSMLAISFGALLLVGVALHRSRRLEFLALREQHDLRASLEKALAEIRTLRGILPMCSFCKSVRDDEGAWHRIDVYVRKHTHAQVSHGFCPTCEAEHYGDA